MKSKIKEIRSLLDDKKISITELTKEYLTKAKQVQKDTNAFTYIAEKEALARASELEKLTPTSILHGIPYSAKDIIANKGIPTTGASRILKDFTPPYDATATARLHDAGAVIIAKNNCDEFAMGGSNENSSYGPVKNPHDHSKVPGGSSGGSAVSVATDSSVFSIGTDTGGSIRQPAAFCGVTGLKVTYGLVPRHGVFPMASSFDTVGPLAHSVLDTAILLDHIAGKDDFDSTSIEKDSTSYEQQAQQDVSGLTIGIPREYMELLDENMKAKIMNAIEQLAKQGFKTKEISLPRTKYALSAYYILVPAEASSNMSRYDGLRYGPSSEEATSLEELYLANRTSGFGDEVKRRILLGSFVLSHGYYDAYYLKAQKVRTLVIEDFKQAFEEVDVIAGPVSPTPAFDIGGKKDPMDLYKEDVFTIPASCAGIPGLSVPIDKIGVLPIGLQLLAPQRQEGRLLATGVALEKAAHYS